MSFTKSHLHLYWGDSCSFWKIVWRSKRGGEYQRSSYRWSKSISIPI